MTEPHDGLTEALRQLRGEVRERISVPAAAGLRARAAYRLRVRRATAGAAAAAAIVAIAIGADALLQPTAGPPRPPAAATPSPRPEPRPVQTLDDPIADVDWQTATITVPARAGCPEGAVGFGPVSDTVADALGPAVGFPKVTIDATGVAYGDLTGDGHAEAVISASCASSEEGLTRSGGQDGQLLVVSRQAAGTLVGLAWVEPPPGAAYLSHWIDDGRLLIDAGTTGATADPGPPHPGLALSYAWDGSEFVGWETAPDYPPILPLDEAPAGAPVQPGAVAGGLGCPDVELRFARAGDEEGTASADGATYRIHLEPAQQYLFDLDNTGHRLLVVGLRCDRPDGTGADGLAVFERAGDGWQGISVLVPETGATVPGTWREPDEHQNLEAQLVVDWPAVVGAAGRASVPYRWTGTVLEPVDG